MPGPDPFKPTTATHGAAGLGAAPPTPEQRRTPEEVGLDYMTNICQRFGNPPDLEALLTEYTAALPPPTTRSEDKPKL